MKLEEFYRALRKDAIIRHAVALEAALSLPVPVLTNAGRFAAVLILRTKVVAKGKTAIYKPEGAAMARFPEGKVARFENYRVADPFPKLSWEEPLGQFPHTGIADWGRDRFEKERDGYLEAFPDFFTALEDSGESQTRLAELANFLRRFLVLTDPALIPLLLSLSPPLTTIYSKLKKEVAAAPLPDAGAGLSGGAKATGGPGVLDNISAAIGKAKSNG